MRVRYLPDRYPAWEAVWQQWRRWRDSGVWEKAMARLAHFIRAALAASNSLRLDIKKPPKGVSGFTPIAPLYKVEHAFARLGRWRRLSRCCEGTEASARAWLAVAATAYLLTRLRTTPP